MMVTWIWAADPKEPVGLEEPVEPPQPYSFTYTAGRYPGHVDRTHSEASDGSGTIRGEFPHLANTSSTSKAWLNVTFGDGRYSSL
jgi:hypothetical protein